MNIRQDKTVDQYFTSKGRSAVDGLLHDRVVHGQCVGQIPHGTLGAPIHASIDGMVSDVTENAITLVRG